ncbi:hypothetical protein [Streptomyces sp. 184]|uniref:hypothetical protein n=1 Tax=Streptomyces sp. 184 TaxID=1827526 RepID=UPI003892A57C
MPTDSRVFAEASRVLRYTIAGIVMLALVYVAGVFAWGGASWSTAPFRGEAEARNRTVGSGEFRISTYEEFFDLCAAVETKEDEIGALRDELDTEPSAYRTEQIHTSLTALRATRSELVNDYNAKSRQEHRKAFKDAGLPAELSTDAKETSCAA